jgi:hypothetical protein
MEDEHPQQLAILMCGSFPAIPSIVLNWLLPLAEFPEVKRTGSC